MKNAIKTLALSASCAVLATNVQAADITDNATDIITVVDACDMKAVGIDFGIVEGGTLTADMTSTNPNNTAGNGITGHTTAINPGTGDDTGDFPAITGVPTALADLVSNALGNAAIAGVTAFCSTTPSAVSITGDGVTATFTTTVEAVATYDHATMAGLTMNDAEGAGTNTVPYSLGFNKTVVAVGTAPLPSIWVGIYGSQGTIASGTTLNNGAYENVLTATLTY